MSWFSKLIGLDKGAELLDNNLGRVSDAVDKFTYTDQEKAEGSLEGLKSSIEFIKSQSDEYSPRSVTRRILAVFLFVSWSLQGWYAIFQWPKDKEYAEFILKIMATQGTLVLMVFGFYFGYYALSNVIKKWKG